MYWKKKPKKYLVSIIAAMTPDGVVGRNNTLPWYVPSDLIRFKELTLNRNIIMGSSTYQSIIKILGTPLPKRNNIVLSRNMKLPPFGKISVARDWTQAFEFTDDGTKEIFIIGGPNVWHQALKMNIIDKMYLTTVYTKLSGDALFPKWDKTLWTSTYNTQTKMKHHKKDEYESSFEIFERCR